MADKTYRLIFTLTDGTSKSVEFTAPQGEKGEDGNNAGITADEILDIIPAITPDEIAELFQ